MYTYIISITVVICEVEVPENGNASVLETGLGSVVEYTCNTGYDLVGISQQICLENDTFSDTTPTCECKPNYYLYE